MFDAKQVTSSLAKSLNHIAALSLLALVVLTCLDVFLRAINKPIIGTYEIVRFLETAVIAFAMADLTIRRGHIAVELVTDRLPNKIQKIIFLIVQLSSCILFAVLCFECLTYGNDLRAAGEVSLTLEIPFYPILYGISFSSFAVCLILIHDFYQCILGRSRAWQ
jgi:TRAP-type C4-dicarboxylate transport system permease small subunit